MNEMIDQVYNFMTQHQMVSLGGRILAAVSGGADSMCLLEVLQLLKERLGAEVRVLHVHHGLRDSAERDLRFVQAYAGTGGIPFRAEPGRRGRVCGREGGSASRRRPEAFKLCGAAEGGAGMG